MQQRTTMNHCSDIYSIIQYRMSKGGPLIISYARGKSSRPAAADILFIPHCLSYKKERIYRYDLTYGVYYCVKSSGVPFTYIRVELYPFLSLIPFFCHWCPFFWPGTLKRQLQLLLPPSLGPAITRALQTSNPTHIYIYPQRPIEMTSGNNFPIPISNLILSRQWIEIIMAILRKYDASTLTIETQIRIRISVSPYTIICELPLQLWFITKA